jgi:hypothetical protein
MEDYELIGNNVPFTRTIKRRGYKIKKTISGRVIFFSGVPDEIDGYGDIQHSLCSNIKECDAADFIAVVYEDGRTIIHKNRYGKTGTVSIGCDGESDI